MRIPTIRKVQAAMRLLEHRISSLTHRQNRKGQAVSYAPFSVIAPNTNVRRLPTPWSGGN